MITFTDEQYGKIMDRLNNGRQVVQGARQLPHKRMELIEDAIVIFAALEDALKEGAVEPEV